jgi:hypothetical protein
VATDRDPTVHGAQAAEPAGQGAGAVAGGTHRGLSSDDLRRERRCGPEGAREFHEEVAARCPAVISSLEEAGDELFTFTRFPVAQWKALRTTNAVERINEEFRRRVKTQGTLPSQDAVMLLLFGLLRSGQIKLRALVGYHEMGKVGERSAA